MTQILTHLKAHRQFPILLKCWVQWVFMPYSVWLFTSFFSFPAPRSLFVYVLIILVISTLTMGLKLRTLRSRATSFSNWATQAPPALLLLDLGPHPQPWWLDFSHTSQLALFRTSYIFAQIPVLYRERTWLVIAGPPSSSNAISLILLYFLPSTYYRVFVFNICHPPGQSCLLEI